MAYKRKIRPGFIIDHQIYKAGLKPLPAGELKLILDAICEYSEALAEGKEPPPLPDITYPASIAFSMLIAKVEQDSAQYFEKCETARRNKTGTTVDDG